MAERGVAVDKFGKTLDFMLSERRNETAATAFFTRAIGNNGFPDKAVIDKSGANLAGLQNVNCLLILHGWYWLIEILQVKYLNNIIEHPSRGLHANHFWAMDHRFIKKLTRQMKGFKPFASALATLEVIKVANMIRKRQFDFAENPHLRNSQHLFDNCVQRQMSVRRTSKFATEPF